MEPSTNAVSTSTGSLWDSNMVAAHERAPRGVYCTNGQSLKAAPGLGLEVIRGHHRPSHGLEIAMDRVDRRRALPDRGRDPAVRPRAHVPRGEHPRHAGLEHERIALERPAL